MNLAWFRPGPVDAADPADDTALLITALRSRHTIDLFDARRAHDFVWMQARRPFDLVVYELDRSPAHQFIWPYLVHYPGVTLLRRLSFRESREAFPVTSRVAWDRARVAVLASRAVVVAHATTAETLAADCPAAHIRHITPGVKPSATPNSQLPTPSDRNPHDSKPKAQSPKPNVVVALEWPVAGSALTEAIAGFADGRAVVVFDTLETADWPSLDPQTWTTRGGATADAIARRLEADPICVTIDPRDESHSLRLALRRLEKDDALRAQLGAAGHSWWRANATVEVATTQFEAVLEEAATLAPPARPADWPSQLTDDGTGLARRILDDFGLELRL